MARTASRTAHSSENAPPEVCVPFDDLRQPVPRCGVVAGLSKLNPHLHPARAGANDGSAAACFGVSFYHPADAFRHFVLVYSVQMHVVNIDQNPILTD
jgi:hypothetical protein